MPTRPSIFATSIAAILLLVACTGGDDRSLVETVWELQSLDSDAVLIGTAVTLEFNQGRILGSAGCNSYVGEYLASRTALSMSHISATDSACARTDGMGYERLMEQENRYLSLLPLITDYSRTSSQLELYDVDGRLLLVFGSAKSVAELTPESTRFIEIVERPAPILDAEILKSLASTSEYFLRVESALSNDCTTYDRYDISRDGDQVLVSIVNLERKTGDCRTTFEPLEHNILLGRDFVPGRRYVVIINGEFEVSFGADESELAATATATQPTPKPSPTATSSPDPTETSLAPAEPTASPTSPATPTPSGSAECVPRQDWYRHTVIVGESLFNIARRAGSTVDEVQAGNCLDDPRRIFAGDIIHIPQAIAQADVAPMRAISYYLIVVGDAGRTGPAVGCEDSAVRVESELEPSGDLIADLTASLNALFSLDYAIQPDTGYVNALHSATLALNSVTLSNEDIGWVEIELSGEIELLGVCADAPLEAQILYTIFQYEDVTSATVRIDGRNMKQIFDESGQIADHEPYRRDELAQ